VTSIRYVVPFKWRISLLCFVFISTMWNALWDRQRVTTILKFSIPCILLHRSTLIYYTNKIHSLI
jgi:hypothetical protein